MYNFYSFYLKESDMHEYIAQKGHKCEVYAERGTKNVHPVSIKEYMDYMFPLYIEEGPECEDLEHDPELTLDEITSFLREEVAYWPAEERAALYCKYKLRHDEYTGAFILERTGGEVTREVINKMVGSIAVHMRVSIANPLATKTANCECGLFGYGDLVVTVYQKAGEEDTAMQK